MESGIWSIQKRHDEDATWLGEVRDRMSGIEKQEEVKIDIKDVEHGIRKMANWEAPGPGFWFKRFRSLHGVITESLQDCLDSGSVPDWMVKRRTVLIKKDSCKGKAVCNCRPIVCLPLMWKLLTGVLAETLYQHLELNCLFPGEQKRCRKRSRATKDQLLIDKQILREVRIKLGGYGVDRLSQGLWHSATFMDSRDVKASKGGEIEGWERVLTSNGGVLGALRIKWGIFQGDSLFPLLFVLAMIPLTILLKRENIGYKFGKEQKMMNHLLVVVVRNGYKYLGVLEDAEGDEGESETRVHEDSVAGGKVKAV